MISPVTKILTRCVVYHVPKPSQVRSGNHAPCQFKERNLDVEECDSENHGNYMKMTFIYNPNEFCSFCFDKIRKK